MAVKLLPLKRSWFVFFIICFASELPVAELTSMDKANPRLFDIAFIVGLFLFRTQIFKSTGNDLVKLWEKLVCWMCLCVFVYAFFIPTPIYFFSLYYLWKYIEGLLVVRMCFLCKEFIDYKELRKTFIWVGIFIALYSIPQSLSKEELVLEIAPGVMVNYPPGTIIGPFNSTYFELAQVSPLCGLFALSHIIEKRRLGYSLIYFVLWLLIIYPPLNSGSRSAALMVILSTVFLLFIMRKVFVMIIISTLLVSGLFIIANIQQTSVADFLVKNSYTIQRSISLEEEGFDDIDSRMDVTSGFMDDNYDYSNLLPFIGGGFYVAPIKGNYRIGYGVHNNYLFAYEQIGIVGFVIMIIFFIKALKRSYKNRKQGFIPAIMCAFMLSLAIVGFSGQSFWRGFGNANVNTLIIFLIGIATEKNHNKKSLEFINTKRHYR